MAIRQWIPPALVEAVGPVVPGRFQRFEVVESWDAAEGRCIGYEQSVLKGPVSNLMSSSKRTRRPTSRDLQFIAAVGICLAASQPGSPVRVLDFGGAYGHYFDVAASAFTNVSWEWTVVETPAVVDLAGKTNTDQPIMWTSDLGSVVGQHWDFVLASAVLQYVPDPMQTLAKLGGITPYALVTRLPLWPVNHHLTAIQRLSRRDRGGAYPAWLFSESVFLEEVRAIGEVVLRFDVPEDTAWIAGHRGTYAGLLIRTRDSS